MCFELISYRGTDPFQVLKYKLTERGRKKFLSVVTVIFDHRQLNVLKQIDLNKKRKQRALLRSTNEDI